MCAFSVRRSHWLKAIAMNVSGVTVTSCHSSLLYFLSSSFWLLRNEWMKEQRMKCSSSHKWIKEWTWIAFYIRSPYFLPLLLHLLWKSVSLGVNEITACVWEILSLRTPTVRLENERTWSKTRSLILLYSWSSSIKESRDWEARLTIKAGRQDDLLRKWSHPCFVESLDNDWVCRSLW